MDAPMAGWLPDGRLEPADWRRRHRFVAAALIAHGPLLFLFGTFGSGLSSWSGASFARIEPWHAFLEASVPVALGAFCLWPRLPRRVAATLTCIGLVGAAALLTHLSGGYIEAHFHFFVVVALASVYVDWVPFLVAGLFVALHHGTVGVLSPGDVYNHPAAFAHPWTWAGIHAVFVMLQGAVLTANMVLMHRWMNQARATERREHAAQLQRAAALEVARTREMFLSTLSHEVRTPLNAMLGTAQLMQANASEEQLQQLRIIDASGRHLLSMVDDILDLGRVDSGNLAIEPVSVPLQQFLQEVVALLTPSAREAGLRVELHMEGVPENAVLDPVRLRQALTNLINNAIKFTPRGSVSVTVSQDGDRLRFVVADTGVGIPATHLPRIFEPFYQAEAGSKGGLGLGLAITRRLVELMDGTITVESEVGVGTRFEISLPYIVPPRLELTSTAALPERGRILIVEDDATNRDVLRRMTEMMNLEVVAVANGDQALQRLETDRFDLAMVDFHLPGMDGFELARRMSDQAPAMRILGISGSTGLADRNKARGAGIAEVLGKPVRMQDLHAALRRHLVAADPGPHA
jgi:signal transduction histidine kinase/CheY-like chemotaxis protein